MSRRKKPSQKTNRRAMSRRLFFERTGSAVVAGAAVTRVKGAPPPSLAMAPDVPHTPNVSPAPPWRTIAADPQHLGAEIGFFAVLHGWGQNLLFHPHLHCVVPGGGPSLDGDR